MNTPSLAAPRDPMPALVLAETAPAAPARRGRTRVERLRKPVSWLAAASLVPLWFYLPRIGSPALADAAFSAGLLAVIAAMLGRLWCALYIAGRKNAELCQDGPYSLSRNPLYVFSFVGALGVALASGRPGLVPVVAVLLVAYYHFVVKSEEDRLAALFPRSYPAYRAGVPRGLPRLHGYHTRTALTLDPRDVTRAMREVVWFPVAFLAVVLLGRLLG